MPLHKKEQKDASNPASNSLVIQVATEGAQPHYQKSPPTDKGSRRLDLLGRKVFSSVGLQFYIVNYRALLAKYDFKTNTSFVEFKDKLPMED